MRPALIAQVALTTAVGGVLASAAGGYVAAQTFDARGGVVLRAVTVTAVLLVGVWFAVRTRTLSTTRPRLRAGALLGLALGYAVSPPAWGGQAYAGELVTAPGAATTLLDLALWLVVGGTAVVVASAPASTDHPPTYTLRTGQEPHPR